MTTKGRPVTLDDAVTAIKEEPVDPRAEAQAVARVRTLLEGEDAVAPGALHGCAEVAALIPAYRRNELGEARRLLVLDHARECVACRERLEQRLPARVIAMPWTAPIERARRARWGWPAYAAAATLVVAIAFFWSWWGFVFGRPEGPGLYVQSIAGELFQVSASSQKALAPGDAVAATEKVRTGGGGQAIVRLLDGSLVEMGQRAQLAVDARGIDVTIQLDRGNIIVQAAKRSRGHLYVAAGNTRVAVTGTVFSVSRGLGGSRVSVIEGEVHVSHDGQENVLHPGQQVSTGAGMEAVPVPDDIAWSRNRADHLKLLAGLAGLQKDLERVHTPGLRYDSRLMQLAPENAVLYVAVPNYGEALAEAHAMLEARLAAGGPLAQWWTKSGMSKESAKLGEAVEKLRALGTYLGDEILFTVAPTAGRESGEPLLIAETRRDGVERFLTEQLFPQAPEHKGLRLRIVDPEGLDGLGDTGGRDEAYVLVDRGLVAMSPRPSALRELVARRDAGSGFGGSDFGRRVAEAYHDGAGVLVALDLEHMKKGEANDGEASTVRHLVLERKEIDGQGRHVGELSFAGQRRGVAAWLSAPAPMGSLSFVSPSAAAVAVFLHEDPVKMLEDVIALDKDRSGEKSLAEVESKLRLGLRDDVAAALGGEVALALDGPLLPQPSWKLVLEVRDADRLSNAIARLVEAANDEAAQHGKHGLQLLHEQDGERTVHALRALEPGVPLEVHYTFADGYMVAAPTRAMLKRALEVHASGQTLAESAAFRDALPGDSEPYCSALVFQNLTSVVGPLVQALGPSSRSDAGSIQALAQAAAESKPTLFALYAESDRIRLAGTGAPLGLDMGTLAVPALLQQAWPGTRTARNP